MEFSGNYFRIQIIISINCICHDFPSDYEELQLGTDTLLEKIRQAYGYDGLGILAVVNVPEYWDKREALLPLAHKYVKVSGLPFPLLPSPSYRSIDR